jgi:hypothetical protein
VAATENFDTLSNLAGSTTNTALPTGWYITEGGGGARDNEQYGVDTGSSTTGDIYSYGAASATDRALGALRSGTLIPLFGAKLTNNTGGTITTLNVSYAGEEWRLGTAGRTDQINFEISSNATDLSTGIYTGVPALNFVTPVTATVGAKDGNAAANRTVINSTITGLTIPAGSTFFIRWTDFDASGADDGLAVDDFSITANGSPADVAPAVSSTVPANNATDVAVNSNIQINFTEPVNVAGNWFQILCPSSGTRQVIDTTVSGGPTSFTINPNTDFTFSEQCTVTVFASQVTDQDANDPPDNMSADATFLFTVTGPPAMPDSVVISQVYGGGGNTSAPFTNDFIELKNPGASPISLANWSVQYASAGGTSWQVTNLTGTLQPGQYYLVQEGAGNSCPGPSPCGAALPASNAAGTIAIAAAAGKVALVNSTTALTTSGCANSHVVDFVGFGSGTNCSEGAAASAPSNTNAILRANNGCKDTDNNHADFAIGAPNPRNTFSPLDPCTVGNQPVVPSCPVSISAIQGMAASANASATDADSTVTSATITSAAVPGITLDGFTAASGIGGIATATLNVANTTAAGTYSVTIQYSNDDTPTPQTASCTVSITINPTPAAYNNAIKLSQVYGGGGNSGSTYTNDFIELYNTSTAPVDISGWSVQYAGATAAFAPQSSLDPPTPLVTVIPANTIMQPGTYYLIQEAAGTGGTTSPPTADLIGAIAMGGTAGKVALVASSTVLSGGDTNANCPNDPLIVDFVGYNSTATCSETSPTAALTNTSAAIRKNNGCTDTNNNFNDFLVDGPIPRNSTLPAHGCGGDATQIYGSGRATPDSVLPSSNSLLTVTVTPAIGPPSTGITVNGNLTSIGGSNSQQFYDDGTHGDATAGDSVFSYLATVGAFIPTGAKNVTTTISDAESRSASAPIAMTVQSPTCGVERWSVKTGGDPDAVNVDLNNPVPTTIGALRALTPPSTPPDNARFAPAENTVYVIRATMTMFKLETDVDYHIVVQDENGATMVTEIPCPCCVAVSSPFTAAIANARQEFDSHFTATTFFQSVSVPVQITGVGFFDFLHGQTGVAPNGIELHPILDIKFLNTTTTNLSSSANPSQFNQSVQFTATVGSPGPTPTGNVTFSEGTTVLASSSLNGSGQASFNISSLSVGSHSITASYPGDDNSLASASSALVQVVNKADQLITFGPLAGKTYGDPDFTVSATASSGLPVSFSIASGPATVSGNTVHITGAGTVTVRASQGGDGNYNAAPDADQSFEVAKATPTITWNNPGDIVYGTLLSATQLNATANVPGSFNYTPAAGALLNAGNAQTLMVTFNPSDAANYHSANKNVQINVLKATPLFSNLSSPTIGCGAASTNLSGQINFGPYVPTGVVAVTLNSVTQNAAIALDGTFTSTFATGSLTPADSPLTITYSYGGDGNFTPAIGGGTLTVGDAVPPTITLNGNSISFWPPNHSYHSVTVSDLVASASDGCDAHVNLNSVVISQVSSDEGTASSGDIVIAADCKSVQLRGDRDGGGDGRVYTITFRVTDVNHNSTTTTAKVTVPHDNGHPNAIDSGAAYTIFGICP